MKTEWNAQSSAPSKTREFSKPIPTQPVEVKDTPSTLGGNISRG
jgi:hypothetical protein